jgi:hypothetical protein
MNDTRKPNRPSHVLWMVEGEGDNATWTELGALWAHAKGDGFNLSLKVLPNVPGARLVITRRKDKQQPATEGR